MTLIAVTSIAVSATVAALHHSMGQVQFGRALLLCDQEPHDLAECGIEWHKIEPLQSRADYSRFVLQGLADHVKTSHALLVQWDGFVRDGRRWSDDFLNYDYIGAPWPQYTDRNSVGNGGFSLRSCRLLEATSSIETCDAPEDVLICHTHRTELEEKYSMKFASIDVARRFSYERGCSNQSEFGFHGVFNMAAELPADKMKDMLASLEIGVIGERESNEMLVRAVQAGDWSLARLAWQHHRARPHHIQRLLRGLGWLLRGHDGWPIERIRAR